jgi:hypothetical protein
VSRLPEIAALLEAHPLSDVVVGGYLETTRVPRRFQPMLRSVSLEFGGRYVRCTAGEQDYYVALELVDEVTCDFAIDEDDEFCVASLFTLLLGDAYTERRVTEFRALEGSGPTDVENGVVGGVEFRFEDEESLVIEPMVPHGLWLTNPRRGLREAAWTAAP